MKYRVFVRAAVSVLIVVLYSLLSSCAVIKAPDGGPEDKTAPAVDSSAYAIPSINFRERHITLRFSEYVDRSKVIENLSLSPEKRLDFQWSGKECEISFPEGLDSNTTYALTLGTDYTDLHGNKPSQAYTAVFSTSSHLDSGIVLGEIVDANPSGVQVYLYALNDRSGDTLNVRNTTARYRTQVGTNGTFRFRALADGLYRVLAVRSQMKDGLVHDEADPFGTTADTVRILNTRSAALRIRLAPAPDRTRPQLVDARPRNAQKIELQFSESLDSASLHAPAFRLRDSSGTEQRALAVFRNPSSAKSIFAVFPTVTSPGPFRIHVSSDSLGPRDLGGLHVNDSLADVAVSLGVGRDSVAPALLSSPFRDSTLNISLLPYFEFSWNTAMQNQVLDASLGVIRNNQRIRTISQWLNGTQLRASTLDSLESDTWYELRFRLNSLASFDGLSAPDSTVRLHFKTIDTRSRGSLEGILVDSVEPNSPHLIRLRTKAGAEIEQKLSKAGTFRFDNLPEGEYFVDAYCDSNSDGRYTSGSAFPYRFAERISLERPSVIVKARWQIQDIRVVLP